MTVGAGEVGGWMRVIYTRYDYGLNEEKWHSGNWEFDHIGGTYTAPNLVALRAHRTTQRTICIIRRAPIRMNELREIDIMDGWTEAQSSEPVQVTDEET